MALVCVGWHNHIARMRNYLFRRYYERLGGDPEERNVKVEDWEKEIRVLLGLKTDLNMFVYATKMGDDALRDSVLDEAGFVMDICNHLVKNGGKVCVPEMLVYFKKNLSTQNQKFEFCDVVESICEVQNVSRVEYFSIKEFLESGKFIKDIRYFFFKNGGKLDSMKVIEWVDVLCVQKKYNDNTKKEIYDFLDILVDRVDEDYESFWVLKKIYSNKRLE